MFHKSKVIDEICQMESKLLVNLLLYVDCEYNFFQSKKIIDIVSDIFLSGSVHIYKCINIIKDFHLSENGQQIINFKHTSIADCCA